MIDPKWADLFGIAPDLPVDEEPKYTESDMRVLTEAALRLGRKEAGEEVAVSIETFLEDPHGEVEDCQHCSLLRQLARVARKITSQPSPDTTSGRTDPGGTPSHPPGLPSRQKPARRLMITRMHVRKLREDERPETIGRWIAYNPAFQGNAYFWSFPDWEGALKFALWRISRQRVGRPNAWPDWQKEADA